MAVPGAPTVGVITPGNLQLSVAFTAGTGTVTNYKYSTDNGATFTLRSGTANPVVITGLTNGTLYSVILRATNGTGDSVSSNMVQSTPRTTPGAPTIGTITFPSSGTISVPFTAPASNGGSAITNYAYSTTGAAGTFTNIAVAQTTSPISISGLTNGTAYQVSIRAINAAGNGTSATAVAATPYTTPAAPTIGAITYPSSGTVSAAFTAGAINGNALSNYEYSTDNGSSWTVRSPASTATPIVFGGLTNGTTYTLKLRAVNAAGSGATQASGTSIIPRTVPDAPTGVTATPGATTVLSISWTAPASNGGNAITLYRIERSLDGVSSWTVLTSAQASSPYNSTALTNGTLYYYRVSATNAAGFGAVSSSASGTPRTVPGAPTIGSVTATSSTAASVPFTAPASNGGNAITSYVVTPYIGAAAQTTVSGASSPISVTGLTTGQSYTFKVHAVNAAGSGAQSGASAAVSLVYNSVSAPSGASYTYASAVALTDSKITYTGTASSDVVITPTGTAWTISAGGNTDTLNFVRKVVFTDKIIYLAGSGVDTNTGSSTVGSNTMSKTIVGGANIIAAYIVNANTEYTANSKVAVIYLAGDTVYTPSVAAADLNIISPVSIVGITMNAKKPLISRWNNHLLRFMMVRSSNVTIENVIFDLNITTGGTEINAGAVDMSFVNGNLTLLENIVFKNVDMVRGYQRGVNMNYMNNVTFDGCTFPRVTTRASIGMVSCKNVIIKNCTVPRSGTTLTGYTSVYIGTSNGPRDIYNFTGSGINPQPTFNNNRSGWTALEKMLALKSTNIDLSLNNTFTDDNSLPATIQLDPYKVENGNDSFQYALTYTGANPDVKLPSGFGYSFTHLAMPGSFTLKTNITRTSTDISGALATWGFDPTNVTVRRLDTNARIYPSGYELPVTTFDPTTITTETTIPVRIGGTRTEVPIRDSTSLSELSALSPVIVTGVTDTPTLAVFTSSDPGAAVKNSIDISVNTVAIQRTVNGTAKTSIMDVKKRSAVTSVVATKTVGGQTQTATADITSLPSTHSVILSVDDIDGTSGLKANIYFKVVDGDGNVVSSGLSLPIDFDIPGTEAISSLALNVYNTSTSSYENIATLTKKDGTNTTFSHTFTTNSDYQVIQSSSNPPPPDAPTVAALDVSSQQLTVSWTHSADGISFDIDVSGSDGSSSTITNASSPHTITGLTNGVTYTVTVTAKNAGGTASASRSALVGRISDAPVEHTPIVGIGRLEVDWIVPADDGGSEITAYNVYWTSASGVTGSALGLSGTTTSYLITGLSGEQYDWSVGAVNAFGEARSATVAWFTPAITPDAPGTPSAVAGNGSVALTWSMSGVSNGGSTITHYNVYNASTDVLDVSSTTNSVTVTGLINGDSYSFYVKAVNAVGEGATSSASSSVTPKEPVTLDLSGLTVTYNGSVQSPIVTGIDAEYVDLTYTATGLPFTGETNQTISYISITATLNNNGTLTYSGNPVTRDFIIEPAPIFIYVRNQSRPYYSPLTIDVSTCSYTNAVTGGDPVTNALYDICGTLYGSDTITVEFKEITHNELLTPVTSQYPDLRNNTPYSNAIDVYDIFLNGTSVLISGNYGNYSIGYNPGSVSVFPTVPSAPTPHIASHSGDKICFTWYTPDNSGGLPLTAYRIYYLAKTPWEEAIALNNPDSDPFFGNAAFIDLSSASLVANAFVLTNAAVDDTYVFVTKAINAAGTSSYYSLYNETAADYAENISRVANQASHLFDGEITPEVASLIEQMVAASGINNYAGTESLRSGLGENVADSVYAFFEAATIAQVGGANLGQTQNILGADAQAIYDHMVAAHTADNNSVEQSLLDLLQGYLTRGDPFPTTYSRFVIDPATRLQVEPYPVIQVTGTSANIIPVPHGLPINFYLNIISNANPDLSGQVLVTRSADNLISNIVPRSGYGVTSISGISFPAAVGSFFNVHLASGGDPISVMIPALAEAVMGLGPDAPTGLRAYNQASTIYVEWDQVSASVGLTSYTVTTPGHSWTVTPPSNSLAITTLDVGQNWTFTVTAVKGAVNSASATVQYAPAYAPCFTVGTRILTPTGYRTVETLCDDDLVVTAAGLTVPVKVHSNTFKAIAKQNAPYIIPAHAFGRNAPPAELRLSPLHAFQIRKGVWQSGRTANNPNVKQYDIGKDVTYYHLECPNYFRDNLIVDGCVVESFAGNQVPKGQIVYTPNRRLGGYTRASSSSSKICHC